MTNYLFQCIDAGTENCPCHLAESGNCFTCSRLSGKACVDCQWRGVCIYNEYIQNGKKINNNRKEQRVSIRYKKRYDDETAVFALEVEKGIAIKCFMPGTYLFLRRPLMEGYFNVPISVMRSDVEEGLVWILVKGISAKSKALLLEEDSFWMRGPYKNGLFGLDSLNDILRSRELPRILVIAKGVGIAPGEKMIQFAGERCQVTLVLDPAKLPEGLAADCLKVKPDRFLTVDLMNSQDQEILDLEILKGTYDGVCLFTSDHFIDSIGKRLRGLHYGGRLIISNNFNLCCGEGICGSCSINGASGETIKMCKCKFSGEELIALKTNCAW